jgi:ABC-2 type transport system permease protein
MRNIWAIAKREFKSYFTTPVGYIILATFAVLSGLFFSASFLTYADLTQQPTGGGLEEVPDFEQWMLSPFLVLCGQLIMFIGPLITMRLLAEERNRGTMELLLTHPLTDRQIVFGKYLAGVAIITLMVSVVGVYMAVMGLYTDIEEAVLVFGLLTVVLMGAAFASLGLFVSALAANQVTAGVLTFGMWLVMWILGMLAKEYLGATLEVPAQWPESLQRGIVFIYEIVRGVIMQLPLDAHAKEMAQGVVQVKDLAYYFLFIGFFLFATLRVLESRRWRA